MPFTKPLQLVAVYLHNTSQRPWKTSGEVVWNFECEAARGMERGGILLIPIFLLQPRLSFAIDLSDVNCRFTSY